MATVYYDDDADLSLIQGRKIAVLGYGSQGHAHALSLRDSGCEVQVGLPEGSRSRKRAEAEGLTIATPAEACAWADVIMVLTPDTTQRQLYADAIAPNLKAGRRADLRARVQHPLRLHHGAGRTWTWPWSRPRRRATSCAASTWPGQGTPVLVAVEQDATGKAWDLARSYAAGIGGTKAGALVTTFQEETESDLFGEQAVLCGGVTALVNAGFETLVEAGYQPEVAYFECLHELKLIVDLMYEGGETWMRYSVSDTAEYGDLTRGPRVISDASQAGHGARSWPTSSRASSPASGWPRTTTAGRTSSGCASEATRPRSSRSASRCGR